MSNQGYKVLSLLFYTVFMYVTNYISKSIIYVLQLSILVLTSKPQKRVYSRNCIFSSVTTDLGAQ